MASVLATVLCGCGTLRNRGTDWPVARGDATATGTSPERSLRPPLGEEWEFRPGSQLSTPVIRDGVVYVGTEQGTVYALASGRGKIIWQTPLAALPVASMAASEQRLYVATQPPALFALDRHSGSKLWTWTPPYGAVGGSNDDAAGLTISDGTIYASTRNGVLAALQDRDEAKASWVKELPSGIAGGPAVAAGKLILSTLKEPALVCLDAKTGDELWRTAIAGELSAPAIYTDYNLAVVATGAGGRIVACDLATGAQKWEFEAEGPIVGMPTLAGGLVVAVTGAPAGASRLYTIDIFNGKKVRERVLPGLPTASPVVASYTIYVPLSGNRYDYVAVSLWEDKIVGAGYNDKAAGRSLCVGAHRLFLVGDGGALGAYNALDIVTGEREIPRLRRPNE